MMKSQILCSRLFLGRFLLPLAAMALFAGALVCGQAARNPNPGILPINSTPYGMSYGEWGAAWWTWGLGIPGDQNPILDPDGSFCDSGQEGPVWFLAGTFGGDAVRTCTVPKGKALFFPIINWVYWAPEDLEFVQDVLAPHFGWDLTGLTEEEILRLGVNWNVDHTTILSLTIDGVEVNDPWQYRAESPAFSVILADFVADWGYEPGLREPNVADGYWFMIRPLTPGEHTIQFNSGAQFSVANGDPYDYEFEVQITYHLTVE